MVKAGSLCHLLPVAKAIVDQALEAAELGRPNEALELIRGARSNGDADASFVEGLWRLEGQVTARDLPGARALLAEASSAGHMDAARVLAGLAARGVGAAPDWPGAIALLREWSSKDPLAARQVELIDAMDGECDVEQRPIVERSASPRAVRVEQFLSADECSFLIELAEPRMKRSVAFDPRQQRFVEDQVRTSDLAAFPVVFEWPFIRAINCRIARATQTAVECGEPLQVLRYRGGQEYRPHCDSSVEMENSRALTAIIWLNDDFEGGATCFDQLGLTEQPARGDLLFFDNILPDGSPDLRSRHAGLAVTSGVKYLASRWIRARPWPEQGFGVKGLIAARQLPR